METPQMLAAAKGICAVALVVLMPLFDMPVTRRLKRHTSSSERLAFYRRAIVVLWCALAFVVALTGIEELFVLPRQTGDIPWLDGHRWTYVIAVAACTAYFALGLWPGVRCALDQNVRAHYAVALKCLRFMLPVSVVERRWWVLVSISAGVCEELLYRGFLLEYLRHYPHAGTHSSLALGWLLSSAAFGVAHLYQGITGVVRTTVAGLAFGLAAILTGNLALPIVLHCIFDLMSLVMYRPAIDAPEDAARLENGCNPDEVASAQ